MSPAIANASSARKKDKKDQEKPNKKVEISLTNWLLGSRIVSGSSSSTRSRPPIVVTKSDDKGDKTKTCKHEKCQACGKKKAAPDSDKEAKAKSDEKKPEFEKVDKKHDNKKTVDNKSEDKKSEDKKVDKKDDKQDDKKDDKKEDPKKSDAAESKKEDGSTGDSGSGEKAWTTEQDTKIKDMKAENKSWKDIALEVGASKKDVQNRHKKLMKSSDGNTEKKPEEKKDKTSAWETGSTGWQTVVDDVSGAANENAKMPDFSALFDDFGDDKEEEKKDDEKDDGGLFDWGGDEAPGSSKKKDNEKDDGGLFDWGGDKTTGSSWEKKDDKKDDGGLFDWGGDKDAGSSWDKSGAEGGAGEKKKQDESVGWIADNEKDNTSAWGSTNNKEGGDNSWGSGDGGKKQKDGKSDKQQSGGSTNWENSGSGDGGKKQKGGTQAGGGNKNNGGGGSHKKNQDFNAGGGGDKNPFDDSNSIHEDETAETGGELKPDGIWTHDDCELLTWLATQYEDNKWLHLQANFYNWTGRMVIAEVIQKKFEDDGCA